MEEYKTLRTEGLLAIKQQVLGLQIGLGAVVVFYATGFGKWDDPLFSGLLFALFIPALCYSSIIIYVAELVRLARVSCFLSSLEQRINAKLADRIPALSWETWLRMRSTTKTRHTRHNYIASICMFLVAAIASILLANTRLWNLWHRDALVLLNLIEALFGVAVLMFLQKRRLDVKHFTEAPPDSWESLASCP